MIDETAIYKAINAVSQKVNEIQKRLDDYLGNRCDANEKSIDITDGGLMDVANILSSHDEAITELASVVSNMSEELSNTESEVK